MTDKDWAATNGVDVAAIAKEVGAAECAITFAPQEGGQVLIWHTCPGETVGHGWLSDEDVLIATGTKGKAKGKRTPRVANLVEITRQMHAFRAA